MDKNLLIDVIKSSLERSRPSAAVAAALGYDAACDILSVRGRSFSLRGKKIFICGFGKCAAEMASGVYGVLGGRIASGVLLSYEPAAIGDRISILKSSHPLPDENTLVNSRRLVEFSEASGVEDLLICLVSGGGSSFFEIPAPGIDFDDLVSLNKLMLKSIMPIDEINAVRKAISVVKGGKFLRGIKSSLITLAVSDPSGSRPADIASGPTVPCAIDKTAALNILEKYNISTPPGIISYLKGPAPAGCIKCSANLNSKNMIYEIISDNDSFIKTAGGLLKEKTDVKVFARSGFMTGEEGGAADFIDSLYKIKKEYSKDFIFIAGGEVPVSAQNKTGRGGRCQHFALEALKLLKERSGAADGAGINFEKIVFAAFATDGIEAFTGAAGAVFDEADVARASLAEIDARLRAADSFGYFEKNGGLIITGATGLNVNDIFIAYCGVKFMR